MSLKPTPNIDYMLDFAKSYIDGTCDEIHFELDYGYEIEQRYGAMVKEDRRAAELIFDCLVEEGSNYAMTEDTERLRKRIKRQYEYVMRCIRKKPTESMWCYRNDEF